MEQDETAENEALEEEHPHPADSLSEPEPEPVTEEPELVEEVEEEDEVEEKKTKREMIEELQEKTKKARWNVFLFLGIGAILFAFALFPMSTPGFWQESNLVSDPLDPVGQINSQILVYGVPPMQVDVTVEVWVMDDRGGDIEVFLIPGSCDNPDLLFTTSAMKNDNSTAFALIEDAAPGSEHEVELTVDPSGGHCFVAWYTTSPPSPSLEAAVHVYSNRIPAGALAAGCLFLSGFAFWGAQKHGVQMRELMTPAGKKSPEEEALEAARFDRLSSGPGATPTPGPAGPPEPTVSGPSGPPTPPSEPEAEPASQTEEAETVNEELNYIPTGDGYFYIQNEDGSYQSQAYYQGPDGRYWPYQG